MTAQTPDQTSRAKILMIDDNRLGLVARKSLLAELGHTVTIASSAQEGIERFTTEQFDLIITDYRMPDMDGVEVIQRARSQYPSIPIILISGFSSALGLNEESTGADLVLQKSATEVPQLIRAVNRLLKRNATPKKHVAAQKKAAPPAAKRTG